MKIVSVIAISALMSLCAASAHAQAGGGAAAEAGPPVLAKDLAPARMYAKLNVTSRAFTSGGALDERYTQNGENVSPPLSWAKGPTGTQSYVVLAEDAGVNRRDPVVHWVIYDIPSSLTRLRANLPSDAKLEMGAMQGLNIRKTAGFIGPKPPAGETHPYHFQVFALNKKLNLDPANADRNAVLDAMKGNILDSGDIVANYTGK